MFLISREDFLKHRKSAVKSHLHEAGKDRKSIGNDM